VCVLESCSPSLSPQISAEAWPRQHFIGDNAARGAAPASPLLPQLLDGHVLLAVLLHHLGGEEETVGSEPAPPIWVPTTPKTTPSTKTQPCAGEALQPPAPARLCPRPQPLPCHSQLQSLVTTLLTVFFVPRAEPLLAWQLPADAAQGSLCPTDSSSFGEEPTGCPPSPPPPCLPWRQPFRSPLA